MCYSCHVEGAALNGSTPRRLRGRQRPTLTTETLKAFWQEDVSDDDYALAAARFFWVSPSVIEKVMPGIDLNAIEI